MAAKVKALCIGATGSGSGKTTITLAILAALRRRGLRVAPFKCGPDFIDPGHHRLAAGRPSHNIDTWMLSPAENRAIFGRHAAGADIAVVEGVMGLYDGFGPDQQEGSTAHLAKLLGIPVALAVDAKGMARSIAAVALGFRQLDRDLTWAGVIANKCGGPGHAAILRAALEREGLMPLLGGFSRDESLTMAERHLGLITAEEGGMSPARLERLADAAEAAMDLDRLAAGLPWVELAAPEPRPDPVPDVRLGVAMDEAFCFYYAENLRRLARAGAEIVPFSPLRDERLPAGLHGLYLGGGYPELFAETLAANETMRRQVALASAGGLPVFAECGGMIYLGRSVTDMNGRRHPMCGALAIETAMHPRLRRLGYRNVRLAVDSPLGPAGTTARGHEFHYSDIVGRGQAARGTAFELGGREGQPLEPAGFLVRRTLASYVHLHFGSNDQLAENFVETCRRLA